LADPVNPSDRPSFDPEEVKQGILNEISDLKETAQA
jgi:hypothetical protein